MPIEDDNERRVRGLLEHNKVLRARVAEQADKLVRYEAELARVYLIADQYRAGRACPYCDRIIEGRAASNKDPQRIEGE